MGDDYVFPHRHILGLAEMRPEDIAHLLALGHSFKEISSRAIKKVPILRGKTVINLFFEPSTRTRLSFEIAAKRMSADTFNISASTSSAVKGETLLDTARNIEAMNPDIIVVRHNASGAPHMLAKICRAAVVNAGDGTHEHPSQGLLDLLTVQEKKGSLAGLQVAIIGDIAHSRVAHSNIIGFTKMGARVRVSGPATMVPPQIEDLGAKRCKSVVEAMEGADVVMALRIQLERQQHDPVLPTLREYSRFYGINRALLERTADGALLMHPGPVNWGVELCEDVRNWPGEVILDQVTNGVAIRMALLYALQ